MKSYLTEQVLDLDRLRRAVGDAIYERGLTYYYQHRVQIEFVEEDFASCVILGKNGYYSVNLEISGSNLLFFCECPYAADGKICKHEVAAVIAVRDYLHTHKPQSWQSQIKHIVQAAKEVDNPRAPAPYLVLFSLQRHEYYGGSSVWNLVPYKVNLSALPAEVRSAVQEREQVSSILKKLPNLNQAAKNPYQPIDPAGCINPSPQVAIIANLLIERSKVFYYSSPSINHLPLLADSAAPLFLGSNTQPFKKVVHVCSEPGHLKLEVNRQADGVSLAPLLKSGEACYRLTPDNTVIIFRNPDWILADDALIPLEANSAVDLLDAFLDSDELLIPKEGEDEFLERYCLALAEKIELVGDAISWEDVNLAPAFRLYLSDAGGELEVSLRFAYGEYELPYTTQQSQVSLQKLQGDWTLARVFRQPELEQQAYQSLSSAEYGLKRNSSGFTPGSFVLRARVHPVDFLMRHVPRLTQAGYEIFGEEDLKVAKVKRVRPTISFNVSSGIDWFDVQGVINFGAIEVSLKEFRKVLRKKDRYIKLADGSIGEIPEEWLEKYKHLFALGEEAGDSLRLSNHHLTMLDQLLAESDRVRLDDEFIRRRQRLKDFSGITRQGLPDGFVGELRPYQTFGLDWLYFLHDFGFGGCLADDMGLGKTVQVLVLLQSLKEKKHPRTASLVVVPRSLLVNWQREADRFTPGLQVHEYFGNTRDKNVAEFDQFDVVITTYGIMLRDVEIFRKYRFHYVVLDESQAIKNPLAQTSKAARLLKCEHRLVLTGTPVENSTYELWSQFAFLNPGLLGNLEYFKREFASPIEAKGDESKAEFLRKMVFPFILRRTKSQVAPELPPRTERILYSDMEPAQRKFYNRTRDYYRGMLLGMLDKQGMDNTRMKILEGLLRLRQICNHPRLVDKTFRGESAKFGLLLETLETLQAEGHKALVFSQFVEMLTLVRDALENRKVSYAYLDGSTRDRQEQVDTFQQNGKLSFFLISLKAGGVGLNLTAADYVIHIDPWWNPAVEMQASDRTHRIGQDKPVFVFKLITRDSVEEKILQLQERKRNLVDQLISTESSFFKSLTADDVKVLFS